MNIYVDADACPNVIKEILFRAADRRRVPVILVANSYLNIPRSEFIRMMQVPDGFDIADDKIVEICLRGDLIVTADIPLAARCVEKGALALNPRGTLYDANNIAPILAARNAAHNSRSMMDEGAGGGPAAFTAKDREKFANELDKFIQKSKS